MISKGTDDKKYKKFLYRAIIEIIGGIVFLFLGFVKYSNPSVGTHYLTHVPVVNNGDFFIFLGISFFLLGIYELLFRKRAFKQRIELEEEKRIEEELERQKCIYTQGTKFKKKKTRKRRH